MYFWRELKIIFLFALNNCIMRCYKPSEDTFIYINSKNFHFHLKMWKSTFKKNQSIRASMKSTGNPSRQSSYIGSLDIISSHERSSPKQHQFHRVEVSSMVLNWIKFLCKSNINWTSQYNIRQTKAAPSVSLGTET